MRRPVTGSTVLVLALSFLLPGVVHAQSTGKPAVTFEDVLAMHRLGLEDDVILKRLSQSPTTFTLGADQLAQLKKVGVSAAVVQAMQARRATAAVGKLTDLAIVLDCSGSMSEKTSDGKTKMEVARKVVADMIAELPRGLRVTLVVYGHDADLLCKAVKVVQELAPLDEPKRKAMLQVVKELEPAGHTPIALAIRTAGRQLARRNDSACGLVLITDGMETCHGDPAAEVAKLVKAQNMSFGVHVVGFDLAENERKAVAEIATAGKGTFYPAANAARLVEITKKVRKQIAEKAEAAPAAEETVKGNRWAFLKVLEPEVRFPKLEEVLVYAAGQGDGFAVKGTEKASCQKYGAAMRLRPGVKYDVWVRYAGNKRVKMAAGLVLEGRMTQLKPEKRLGMIRVNPGDLPKAKSYWATVPGANGYLTGFDAVQEVASASTNLVLPVGSYKIWLSPADGSRRLSVVDKVEVKAGKVVVVE